LELFHTFILTDNQQISHRATPILRFQRSRPDRPDFFLIQKRNSAGGTSKNAKVRAGGAGQPLAGKRRGLCGSRFQSFVVK
jgi:hypothetical protein